MLIIDWSSDVCASDLGLDRQAVLTRGEAADPDAEARVREVARRGEEMREDAKSAADGGNRNLRDNKGILGGGPAGPIDFDQMLQASNDLEASDKGAPQLIVFASFSMPEQSLKTQLGRTSWRERVVPYGENSGGAGH